MLSFMLNTRLKSSLQSLHLSLMIALIYAEGLGPSM